MLAWTRDFARLDAALRDGAWLSQWAVGGPPPVPWPELAGKTLAIVGYGRIGRGVAARARAFDMRVLAIRRDLSAPDGRAELRGPDALLAVLEAADYVVITAPLTAETRGLIDTRALAAMKRSAMLVNVARAEIVDEDALYRALADRAIAGAALDVWYRYPTAPGSTLPGHRPFHTLPNVLLTPHVSGWTEGMLDGRAALIAGNIARAARGEPPVNLVAGPGSSI
jgi:phosphoglycerate dehydrogenase-like enzyme